MFENGLWQQGIDLPIALARFGWAAISNTELMIIGGATDRTSAWLHSTGTYMFNTETETWTSKVFGLDLYSFNRQNIMPALRNL